MFFFLCFYAGRSLEDAFDGIFPRDNLKNARFAVNFFTSIGLGDLTLKIFLGPNYLSNFGFLFFESNIEYVSNFELFFDLFFFF